MYLTKANEQAVLLVRVGGARFLGCCGNGATACNDRRFLVCVRPFRPLYAFVELLALCETGAMANAMSAAVSSATM